MAESKKRTPGNIARSARASLDRTKGYAMRALQATDDKAKDLHQRCVGSGLSIRRQ